VAYSLAIRSNHCCTYPSYYYITSSTTPLRRWPLLHPPLGGAEYCVIGQRLGPRADGTPASAGRRGGGEARRGDGRADQRGAVDAAAAAAAPDARGRQGARHPGVRGGLAEVSPEARRGGCRHLENARGEHEAAAFGPSNAPPSSCRSSRLTKRNFFRILLGRETVVPRSVHRATPCGPAACTMASLSMILVRYEPSSSTVQIPGVPPGVSPHEKK
jgi:hypothetical protein